MHAGFQLFAFLSGNDVGSLLPSYLCHHKGWKLLSSLFFFKQTTSLSLTHSTEGNGAFRKPPNMARLMVKELVEKLLAPQGTGVFRFALAWCITEHSSSTSSKTVFVLMEFITWTKRRKEKRSLVFSSHTRSGDEETSRAALKKRHCDPIVTQNLFA